MTRILIPRGSSGSSSNSPNQDRSGSFSARQEPVSQAPSPGKDEDCGEEVMEQVVVGDELLEYGGTSGSVNVNSDEPLMEDLGVEQIGDTLSGDEVADDSGKGVKEEVVVSPQELVTGQVLEIEGSGGDYCFSAVSGLNLPPPPVPPPKPYANNWNSRRNNVPGNSDAVPGGSPRRGVVWHGVSSPAGSRPSSPRTHGENEGYNSADEQNSCLVSSHDDKKEMQFEIDIRRAEGYEVKRMLEDGNCLFRAIADQVYGDSELYDLVRQMCIDYMEQERDHYSQFITEGFTSYCKRKRIDKVYGNNVEIQAVCEMYNRPIHIYSYSTEPINIFQRSYNTDTPPIRLSYHRGNHYNSLVDPRRSTIGAGLGFSSLRERNVDKDQVKAAIKAQQDQQIDNALLAEGRFYSDLEITEKEIELAVMEASRAEYLGNGTFKQQLGLRESSTSNAGPSSSSSGASSDPKKEQGKENDGTGVSSSIEILLSMGFSYLQAVEAYSIFGDDVDIDSMIYYLLETGSGTSSSSSRSSKSKGKAAESSQLDK